MENLLKTINAELLLIISAVSSFLYAALMYARISKNKRLYDFSKPVKKKKQAGLLKKFRKKMWTIMVLKDKTKHFKLIYYSFLILNFAIFLFILKNGAMLLALLVPVIIITLTDKILDAMLVSIDAIIQRNFPTMVNHMIKVLSKTNDISVVLYETSFYVEEPLRSLLLKMTRELATNNTESGLMKFMNEIDNLWVHSFLLTLLNYKRSSSKEEVINSFLALSEIVVNKQDLTRKMVSDRKPVVIINYMLMFVGVALLIGNLIMNPKIIEFFFGSALGNVSLLGGVVGVMMTIFVNTKLIKE